MQERLQLLVGQMHKGGILYREAVVEFKKALIRVALQENAGNVSKAAPSLGLHRNTLSRLCFELEVDAKSFRPARRRPPRSVLPAFVKHSAR